MKSDNQQKAFDKFKRLKVGALFMKQGSGKTRVAVDLINSTDCELAIFLCPYSTKSNLEQEIHKWQLCKKYIIVGYETLSSSDRVYFELLEDIKGKKVFTVADESVFIKNENSKRHMRAIEISKRSEYRLLLNGTPITKNEWDLYNQMMFLSPKIINMSRHEFLNTFFDHIQYKRKGEKARDFYKLSDVNIGYLHKLIAPYIFECDLIFDKDISRISVEITASSDAILRKNKYYLKP
ncbi:SNF2-related protein [Veillonella sp.]|uniref:SNF2-related protein n=1 Tax=Veillonella sp. TaxID=1926307 RepID=UPI0025DE08B4|nr:SNF2-related protein [Veillonella sp.]